VLDDVFFAADHLAVAAFESPDAAAGADVDIMDAFGREFLGAANVIDVVRITAIEEDVISGKFGSEIGDGGIDDGRGNHEPDGARLLELGDQVVDGRGAGSAFAGELLHRFGAAVVNDAFVSRFLQAANHVRAHTTETDHAELHVRDFSAKFWLFERPG
jgi:hypothetical protein